LQLSWAAVWAAARVRGVFLSSVLLLRAVVEAVFFNWFLLVFFTFAAHFWVFTGITSGRKWLLLPTWRSERKCLNRRRVARSMGREKIINN
jgi:hypothetical protein